METTTKIVFENYEQSKKEYYNYLRDGLDKIDPRLWNQDTAGPDFFKIYPNLIGKNGKVFGYSILNKVNNILLQNDKVRFVWKDSFFTIETKYFEDTSARENDLGLIILAGVKEQEQKELERLQRELEDKEKIREEKAALLEELLLLRANGLI